MRRNQSDAGLRSEALRRGWPRNRGGGSRAFRAFLRHANNLRRHPFTVILPTVAVNQNAWSGEYRFRLRTGRNLALGPTGFVQLREMDSLVDTLQRIVVLWEGLTDYQWMSFTFSDGTHRIHTPLKTVQTLTPTYILNVLQYSLQSNQDFDLNNMTIHVKYSLQRTGRGGTGGSKPKMDYPILKKKCVYVVTDTGDNFCFFRALAICTALIVRDVIAKSDEVAKCIADRAQEFADEHVDPLHVLKGRQKVTYRTQMAECYAKRCNVDLDNYDGTTIEDLAYVEQVLRIGILVLDLHTLKVLKKPQTSFPVTVAVLMDNDHYHAIHFDRIHRLWDKMSYCKVCYVPYQKVCGQCKSKCFVCRVTKCSSVAIEDTYERRRRFEQSSFVCSDCEMFAFDEACLERHIKICTQNVLNILTCKKCGVRYNKTYRHRCSANAQQFITPPKAKPVTTFKYAYYDFECTIDEGVHTPAMVVLYDEVRDRMTVFDSAGKFLQHICSRAYKGYTFIAHNSAKYDFHFLKQVMIQKHMKSNDLGSGTGILYSELPDFNIRFVDSLRFLQFSLRSFPKTFGFSQVTKGYFPYTFFTKDNKFYAGPMPGIEHFDFGRLHVKERKEAIAWYNEHENDIIDLWSMCEEYCKDDVRVLAAGCRVFRNVILESTDGMVDPFQQITIAGTALKIYLLSHMPLQSISIIPPKNMSRQFEFEARKFYDGSRVAFYPCYSSGCPRCFGDYTVNRMNNQFMIHVRKDFDAKNPVDADAVLVRECEWIRRRDREKDVKAFIEQLHDEVPYAHPRDGFFGGRTEVFIMYRKCREGERIRYLDYTSLYPSIQFGTVRGVTQETYSTKHHIYYPIGDHVHIKPADLDISTYFGFIKCRVRSPDYLLYPVLPVRTETKLLFPLGTMTGTWCTEELQLAVRKGYVIEQIYDVWHYPNKSHTLFKDYVVQFLKLKQEAMGWKKIGISDPEEQRAYCETYRREMGIEIHPQEDYNPGMYKTSKILLNSLWGKFAQRLNFANMTDTMTYEEFAELAYNEEHVVKSVIMHDDVVRSITYERRYDCVEPNMKTNVAVAAFTTAHARVRLYEVFEHLEGKLLYCDTDSVIFLDDGTVPLVCGEFLGDLTDELDADDYIEEFIATAPKSYAYRTFKGKEHVKMKGVTLDGYAERILDFDAMKSMVDDPGHVVRTKPLQFRVDAFHNIRTRKWDHGEGKITQYTFNKRQRTEEYQTIPIVIGK